MRLWFVYIDTWPAATRVSLLDDKGGKGERAWERGWRREGLGTRLPLQGLRTYDDIWPRFRARFPRPFCRLWSLDYTRASLEHCFWWLDSVLRETIGRFFVVEFHGSVRLLNSPFKCNVIYALRRLHLSKSEGTMYDSAVCIELCSSATKTDNGLCGRITNFPSCTARSVAIVPLDHDLWSNDKLSELCSSAAICATWSWILITTLTFALNTCTVLTKSEQMKRSNTTEVK